MRTVRDVYPTKWLHADDLEGQAVPVRIEAVEVLSMRQRDGGEADRIVLTFVGKQKRLVCNKTQAYAVARLVGEEEFEKWAGRMIRLRPGRAMNGRPTIVLEEVKDAG